MTFGNSTSFHHLKTFLSGAGRGRTLLVSGPRHSGKSTALSEAVLDVVGPDDSVFPDRGVEAARGAVEFSQYAPQSGPMRAVCVVDSDLLTDAARDAYLKLSEEAPDHCCIVFTSSDPRGMSPALVSRVRDVIRWEALDADEMRAFAESVGTVDEDALSSSCGLPGMYVRLAHQPKLRDLQAAFRGIMNGSRNPIMDEPPSVISKLDAKSDDRAAVVHILRLVSRSQGDMRARLAVLEYARTLFGQPSANAEIHWFRMASRLRAAV